MSHCAPGAAAEAGRQQRPGTVWLAGLLAPGCSISQAGQAVLSFAGELDVASRTRRKVTCGDAIDAHGRAVLLDMAGLSFCDARGLGALVRMSRHAGQAGSCLHLVAPPPLLVKIIRITGLGRPAAGACQDRSSDRKEPLCAGGSLMPAKVLTLHPAIAH